MQPDLNTSPSAIPGAVQSSLGVKQVRPFTANKDHIRPRRNGHKVDGGKRLGYLHLTSPCVENRVGDGVTPVALSHHRTCGSASGGSLDTLESSQRIEQRHQT